MTATTCKNLLLIIVVIAGGTTATAADAIDHIQGEMAGEVTSSSVILQSRLTGSRIDEEGDVPGSSGMARFEISDTPEFRDSVRTEWIEAEPDYDYIIKSVVRSLQPNTRYYYRLEFGLDKRQTRIGPTRTFKTHPGPNESEPCRFVVVTGMNHSCFYDGRGGDKKRAYHGADKALGYPALATIRKLKPDFFVGTGDNVYYDHPLASRARTQAELRRKWHQQFVQPRFVELFSQVPTYWEKDDHDHRFNDCDPHTPVRGIHETAEDRNNPDLASQPSNELGIRTFWEQVPVVDPREKAPKTYRTYRVNRDLQIWLVEGRDYRSPNSMPDGPKKNLGQETDGVAQEDAVGE